MKKFATNLAVLIATLVICFAIGEGVCRLGSFKPMKIADFNKAGPASSSGIATGIPDNFYQYTKNGGVRLTPNLKILVKDHYLSHTDVELSTNSLGFRGREISNDKKDEFRILVLGDSITLGDYIDEAETYPAMLEKSLKSSVPNIFVINAGIGSSDIKNEYFTLLESGLKAKPDLVLVGMYLNDGEMSASFIRQPLSSVCGKSCLISYLHQKYTMTKFKWKHRAELKGRGDEWLSQFRLNNAADESADWTEDRAGLNYLIVKNYRDWGAAWNPKTWSVISQYASMIKNLCEKNNIPLAIVLLPVRYQVESNIDASEPQRYFDKTMNELNITHFDLLPVLKKYISANSGTDLYFDKCHMKPNGNEIVGRAIAQFLIKNGLVTSKAGK